MKKATINRTIAHEAPQKILKARYHFVSEDLYEKIKKKAHELYEGRGHLPGTDLTDWLEAEKLIRAQQGDHFNLNDLQEKIAQKAFEIYEGRGCLPNGDMSDWLEAEKIILEEEVRTS